MNPMCNVCFFVSVVFIYSSVKQRNVYSTLRPRQTSAGGTMKFGVSYWIVSPQRTQRWAPGCPGPWCEYCTRSTGRAPEHSHIQAGSDVTCSRWHWSYWSPGWWSSFAAMRDWAPHPPRLRPPPLCPPASAWSCWSGDRICIDKNKRYWNRNWTLSSVITISSPCFVII